MIPPTVRNAVCSCSTGSESSHFHPGSNFRTGYYPTKGHAINDVDAALQAYDFCIDRNELGEANRFAGDEGRETFTVRDDHGKDAGQLVCVYYRMNSGRYEFVTYAS